eukprot:scaffold116366_cov15-Phaeocystis_antarctica.AAC.1
MELSRSRHPLPSWLGNCVAPSLPLWLREMALSRSRHPLALPSRSPRAPLAPRLALAPPSHSRHSPP